jgi:hypothetical protein
MNRAWLKVLSVLWLVIITPIFGLIPLWCIACDGSGAICNIERALLLDVWLLLAPNHPEPIFDHEVPPLTAAQWWAMISIVLGVAIVALYYCCKWWIEIRRQRTNIVDLPNR